MTTTKHHRGHKKHYTPGEIAAIIKIFIAITGARACGKSTILKFLSRIFGIPFIILESSEICDKIIEAGESELAKELLSYRNERSGGGFYPDELIGRAHLHYIGLTLNLRQTDELIEALGMAGAFRTEAQEAFMRSIGFKTFKAHIHSRSLREVFTGVLRRKKAGITREDDEPDAVANSYVKYKKLIVPHMEKTPGDLIVTVEFSDSLINKIDAIAKAIGHFVGGECLRRYLEYADINNPLRTEIVMFEKSGPQALEFTPRMLELIDIHDTVPVADLERQRVRFSGMPKIAPHQLAGDFYGSCIVSQR